MGDAVWLPDSTDRLVGAVQDALSQPAIVGNMVIIAEVTRLLPNGEQRQSIMFHTAADQHVSSTLGLLHVARICEEKRYFNPTGGWDASGKDD